LKNQLQQILSSTNLEANRALIRTLCTELDIDSLTCAAALLTLIPITEQASPSVAQALPSSTLTTSNVATGIKLIRYRLDVGSKQQVTADQLRKLLIEESGVDKNNINNIHIHGLYTLLELPDEMPPDIFLHLKTVEINQHKLDIRRVKANNKRRGNNYIRRGRKRDSQAINGSESKPDTSTAD
jgi:DbpA RNA binding domain